MSKGYTDWTDLGIFPLQDTEEGVPIGMRMMMVGGRVLKRPDAGDNGAASLTEYAREDGMGTLGDIHPWFFWQTKEREKRPMGSWSMAWAAIVTDSANARYGGEAGLQPLTRNNIDQVNDIRYRVVEPAWQSVLPWQPEGMLAMVMPSTDEVNPSSVMLSCDRRLVAAGVGGPGQAGTTIVDMQPDGVLCMGGGNTPGQGGRHARLHGLVRVIALARGSGGLLGGPDLNGIAINYGVSQQDGILGYGMIFGPSVSGGGGSGPTTGQTSVDRPGPGPITGGGGGGPPPPPGSPGRGPGGPPPPGSPGDGDFAGSGGGAFGSGGPEGPNASKETSVADFGTFRAEARVGHAIGFMSGNANGPIVFGCGKHFLGVDKDGHRMTPAHISTNAYFYSEGDRDGPLMFEGRFPDNVGGHPIPSLVHLSWDDRVRHSFIGGEREGKWRWWTTVPYVESEDEDGKGEGEGEGEGEGGKSGPSTPGAGTGPTTPGAGTGPTTGGGGGGPSAPGAPPSPGSPTSPSTPGSNPAPAGFPTGPITPGGKAEEHEQGPITAPKGRFDDPPDPPDPPWISPLKPKGPITPRMKPNAPPTPRYLLEGLNQQPNSFSPVAPGSSVFPGRGTKYNSLDLEPIADTVKESGGPAGIVNQVGGSERGRDVGLYSIFHPFNTGFAAISFRPQLWIKGAPNFEHNPLLSTRAYKTEERTRPSVLTIRAWGAQSQSGDWDYVEPPVSSRARGGLVNGGILIAPSEFEMEDYLGINSTADTDNPTTKTYLIFAPTVAATFGKPTTDGVPTIGSKLIHQDTATGVLLISAVIDAVGATTDILKASVVGGNGRIAFEGTGAVKLPAGSTAQRPVATIPAGLFRYNTSTQALEFTNGFSWKRGAGETWLNLPDTPVSFTALKIPTVNSAGTALEFPGLAVTSAGQLDGDGKKATNFAAGTVAGDLVEVTQATTAFFPFTGGTITGQTIISAGDLRVADTVRIGTSLAVGQAGVPDASAVLECESTTKGLLPPRMTTTQRDAISSPATGLTVYNTTSDTVDVFTGAAWESLAFSA